MSDLSPAPGLAVYGRMDGVLLLFTMVVTHFEAQAQGSNRLEAQKNNNTRPNLSHYSLS